MPERLRWHRHLLGFMQSEVADKVGVSRAVYADLEGGECKTCPSALADALAKLYQVSPEELLDDYNLFLYRGQARQIQEYRKRSGLSCKAFSIRHFLISAWLPDNKTSGTNQQESVGEIL